MILMILISILTYIPTTIPRAVIAESYERIHRSNLVGMGIVPLQYMAGETAHTLGLTGVSSYYSHTS